MAIFAIVDFDLAFEIFHKIIFPDSNKVELALSFHYCDTLTNVLTGDFFMHIGTIIGITFIGILVFSIILCGLFKKYGSHLKSTLFKKQNKKIANHQTLRFLANHLQFLIIDYILQFYLF